MHLETMTANFVDMNRFDAFELYFDRPHLTYLHQAFPLLAMQALHPVLGLELIPCFIQR